MAKTRRTRKEKMRASLRQTSLTRSTSSTITPPHVLYALPTQRIATTPGAKTLTYTHISHDLLKTLFITGAIILAQIILFVLLQNR